MRIIPPGEKQAALVASVPLETLVVRYFMQGYMNRSILYQNTDQYLCSPAYDKHTAFVIGTLI